MSDRKLAALKFLYATANILVLTLILGTMSLRSVQAQTPTAAERKELLEVRRLVWDSYFNNDQGQLKRLIGDDFLTINPGEEHWQNKAEFLAGAHAFAEHQGKLVSLAFPKTEIQEFGGVAVLYSIVQITMESGSKQESLNCRSTEVFQKREGQWVNTGAHVDSGR